MIGGAGATTPAKSEEETTFVTVRGIIILKREVSPAETRHNIDIVGKHETSAAGSIYSPDSYDGVCAQGSRLSERPDLRARSYRFGYFRNFFSD